MAKIKKGIFARLFLSCLVTYDGKTSGSALKREWGQYLHLACEDEKRLSHAKHLHNKCHQTATIRSVTLQQTCVSQATKKVFCRCLTFPFTQKSGPEHFGMHIESLSIKEQSVDAFSL